MHLQRISISHVKNPWSFKILFDKNLQSFQSNISSKVLASRWELEIGSACGGPASAVNML